jgi:transcriptional regulator with XRE-family HTH domain
MPDPLVSLLKAIRRAHGISQRTLETRMGLPEATYRHIESGRRNLPDYRNGLVEWIKIFVNCVHATEDERRQIIELMSHEIVQQFSRLLDDWQTNDP